MEGDSTGARLEYLSKLLDYLVIFITIVWAIIIVIGESSVRIYQLKC